MLAFQVPGTWLSRYYVGRPEAEEREKVKESCVMNPELNHIDHKSKQTNVEPTTRPEDVDPAYTRYIHIIYLGSLQYIGVIHLHT